jgi:hypothetical protein
LSSGCLLLFSGFSFATCCLSLRFILDWFVSKLGLCL